MNPLILLALVGGGFLLANQKKPKKKKEEYATGEVEYGGDYDPEYGKGSVPLEANYRLAVIQGESCGDCKFGSALKAGYDHQKDVNYYCNYWKTGVRTEFVCNAFEPKG